jgi:hypothetical protein
VNTRYAVASSADAGALAVNKLTTDEWRKIREYAKEKGDYFAQQALAEFQKKTGEGSQVQARNNTGGREVKS